MSGMSLNELDFRALMPVFMQSDEAVIALCKSLNSIMSGPVSRTRTISTWGYYDSLSESECDEMAYELDIDWYDSSSSLDQKRETVKYAQEIKRKRGTKWAVEALVSSYFKTGYVTEWFENSGTCSEPYTFAVLTDSEITEYNYTKFIESANLAKNARSKMVGIYLLISPFKGRIECTGNDSIYSYGIRSCGTYPEPGTIGILESELSQIQDVKTVFSFYNIKSTSGMACGTYPSRATKGISEIHDTESLNHSVLMDFKITECGSETC